MRKLTRVLLAMGFATKAFAGALDTWTQTGTATNNGYFGQVVYGGGTFVANYRLPSLYSFEGQGGVMLSHDGTHWTNFFTHYLPVRVAYGNGQFVVGEAEDQGYDSGLVDSFSTNFSHAGYFVGFARITGVTYFNGKFVASAYFYEEGEGVAYVSTNGTDWSTNIPIGTDFFPYNIATDGAYLYAVGGPNLSQNSNQVFYSTDATNWYDGSQFFAAPVAGTYTGISYINGSLYVSETSGTNTFYYRDWAPFNPPAPNLWLPTSGTNSLYVSLGPPGTIYTSANATNWTAHATGLTNTLTGIAYGGGRFVAVSADGSIFLSGSTTPSLAVQNFSTSNIQLTISGGLGPTYHIQASTNLTAWTNLTVLTNIGVTAQYVDTNAGNFALRYYQTVSP